MVLHVTSGGSLVASAVVMKTSSWGSKWAFPLSS